MINFDTRNLIIVCYPGGAGGKFLINSLGLSDDCVFQDADLASRQLQQDFTPADKFSYLTNKINKVTGEWHDLDLGCVQLFGVTNFRLSSCSTAATSEGTI